MSSPAAELFVKLLEAWRGGEKILRIFMAIAMIFVIGGASLYSLGYAQVMNMNVARPIAFMLLAIGGLFLLGIANFQMAIEESKRERRIEEVQRRAEENPKETKAAWEIARVKLENYLSRNISQVRSIFWLTVVVMALGFGLIGYGVIKLYETPDNLEPSIVVAVSGILVNFIGGSFLIIYRSTMSQAKDYVTVLERINAVGMAVQILETIDDNEDRLKSKTTAEIAKQMLKMYSIEKTQ